MTRLPKFPKFGAGDQRARIERIAAYAGVDLAAFSQNACVVAGSNGKGSTAAMLASILSQTGAKTGRFTSPHLFTIHERFAVDGEDISQSELMRCWILIEEIAGAWLAQREDQTLGGFEFLFLVAALWFQREQCAFTIWEAGIGGRHDVTRLVKPAHAALVSLDLEHTHLLGDTLEEIALDKADVAPNGGALYLSPSVAPFAEKIHAHVSPRDVAVHTVAHAREDADLPLAGDHQRRNAALAAALARAMAHASDEHIARGLARTRWPGRLETISADPPIVIDVGHTPAAIDAALAAFRAMHPQSAILVCGASADKDSRALIARLAPAFEEIFCAAARHKGADAREIAASAAEAAPRARIHICPSVADARARAIAAAQAKGTAIYVGGGLFLAAEFKAVHEGRDPARLVFF